MERFSQIGLQAWSWNFWRRRARGKSFGQAHWIAIAFFYPCRCWTQHRIFGFRGFKSIRTPLSVLWPVSGFWQEDTARKWWAATNISVFQSKGPRPMKRRWSMRRPIVTLSNIGLFWQQASYYDDVDCNWLCELNLQWLLPWSHFWLQVSWWHSSMLSMPANLCWKDNYCYFIVALVFFCLRALIKTELNWTELMCRVLCTTYTTQTYTKDLVTIH